MSPRTSDADAGAGATTPTVDEKANLYLDPGAEQIEGDNNALVYSIDPDEERAVVRKLDMVIMPLMILVYFFQYLDKQSISQAAIFGLRDDLGLSGSEFSWAVSLFYLGQLVSEWPAMFLLSRLPITLYVGVTIILWGGVNMCLAAVHDFKGLAAARFMLGFTEGTVSPAFIIITSNWYKRREHPLRTATWISMNGLSQIIGALIMYGIGRGNLGLPPWRLLFLICGGLTAAIGILFLVAMPRDTTTAWFLNPRERELATQRLALDRATRDRSEFNKAQMVEAFKSPFTWLYFMMALCLTLTTPIIKFNSTVINGFGYDKFQTMLVGLPTGAVNFSTTWISALVPRFFPGTRVYTGMMLCLFPLLGAILLLSLPQEGADWGIIVSTWLGSCSSAILSAAASIIASNVKGNTKKSVVSAGFFISYCVGCIVSPQAWTEDDAPRYTKGCILSIAAMVAGMMTFATYAVMVKRENKARDRQAENGRDEYAADGSQAGQNVTTGAGVDVDSDLTDIQDKAFRYAL